MKSKSDVYILFLIFVLTLALAPIGSFCSEIGNLGAAIANEIVGRLCEPVRLMDCDIRFGGSVGIAAFPMHANSVSGIIAAADEAMYKAKEAGRNCYFIYQGETKE